MANERPTFEKKSSRAMEVFKKVNGIAVPIDEAPKSSTPPPVEPKKEAASAQKPIPAIEADPSKDKQLIDFDVRPEGEPKETAPKKEAVTAESKQPNEPVAEDDESSFDSVEYPKQEQFKQLRDLYKKTKKKVKELAPQLETLTKKVSDYESGLVVPEKIAELQSRIEALTPFEQMYNLEASPAYRQQFVEPVEKAVTKLKEIAGEYQVPDEALEAAINATSRVERNKILSTYFRDELGAAEAKEQINIIADTRKAQVEARAKPSVALQEMMQKQAAIEQEQAALRAETIIGSSKNAWKESINQLQTEQRYPELLINPANEEYNQKVVLPVRQAAAKNFGQIINGLAAAGLKTMPPEIARTLAYTMQVAFSATFAQERALKLEAENAELKEALASRQTYSRPSVNGMAPPTNSFTTDRRKLAARKVLEGVTSAK